MKLLGQMTKTIKIHKEDGILTIVWKSENTSNKHFILSLFSIFAKADYLQLATNDLLSANSFNMDLS